MGGLKSEVQHRWLYFVKVYCPEDSISTFVISKPIYRSHDQAVEDAMRIFQQGLPDQSLKAAPMTKYGETLNEKNGYKLMQVVNEDAEGNVTVVGFAILNPDGSELSRFSTRKEALDEFERLTDDYTPPTPSLF